MRASALELRSKICAMNESRFNYRCACAACAGGHMGDVQEAFVDKTLVRDREARNFNIAHVDRSQHPRAPKIFKKDCGNCAGNPLKRKPFVISSFHGKYPPLSPHALYREMRCRQRKYHAASTTRQCGLCARLHRALLCPSAHTTCIASRPGIGTHALARIRHRHKTLPASSECDIAWPGPSGLAQPATGMRRHAPCDAHVQM